MEQNDSGQSKTAALPADSDSHLRQILIMVGVTSGVMIVGLLVYLFLHLGGRSGVIRNESFSKSQISNQSSQATTNQPFDPAKPWLSLEIKTPQAIYSNEQPINLIIKGHSAGKDIQGYDILLAQDEKKFELISANSLHSAFQIYQFKKPNHYTFTGLKQLTATQPTVFEKNDLIELIIKPKATGRLTLYFLQSEKREQTKFVDNNVQVIRPQLVPLVIEIK